MKLHDATRILGMTATSILMAGFLIAATPLPYANVLFPEIRNASPSGGVQSGSFEPALDPRSNPVPFASSVGAPTAEAGASTGVSPNPSTAVSNLAPASSGPIAVAVPTRAPLPPPPPAPMPPPVTGWVTVVNDQFNSGGVPGHWASYDGPYGSGPRNCAAPSHATVSGGVLNLRLSYEANGAGSFGCGPGWYSGGLALQGFSSIDQQVTVRFRVVRNGAAGHYIIPMRWPDNDASWPAGGEEDYCESDLTSGCDTFLHYSASNAQVYRQYAIDLSAWHTIRIERRSYVVRIYFDDLTTPVWTYTGSSATLPDTLKHVGLQQECQSSCPAGTTGTENLQIDWITVANPG